VKEVDIYQPGTVLGKVGFCSGLLANACLAPALFDKAKSDNEDLGKTNCGHFFDWLMRARKESRRTDVKKHDIFPIAMITLSSKR
jgi:hypothetical protein